MSGAGGRGVRVGGKHFVTITSTKGQWMFLGVHLIPCQPSQPSPKLLLPHSFTHTSCFGKLSANPEFKCTPDLLKLVQNKASKSCSEFRNIRATLKLRLLLPPRITMKSCSDQVGNSVTLGFSTFLGLSSYNQNFERRISFEMWTRRLKLTDAFRSLLAGILFYSPVVQCAEVQFIYRFEFKSDSAHWIPWIGKNSENARNF